MKNICCLENLLSFNRVDALHSQVVCLVMSNDIKQNDLYNMKNTIPFVSNAIGKTIFRGNHPTELSKTKKLYYSVFSIILNKSIHYYSIADRQLNQYKHGETGRP